MGLVLLLGTMAVMLYEGIWGDHSPADVVVEVTGIARVNAGYRIEFRATNRGGTTAEGVTVEAQLTGRGGERQRSETIIDYLPGGSSRSGGLFLPDDPSQGSLVLRALGYENP